MLLSTLATGVAVFLAVGYATGHFRELSVRRAAPFRLTQSAWLAQAGAGTSPLQFWTVSVLFGFTALLLGWAVSGSVAIAVVPGLVAAAVPRVYYARRRARRVTDIVSALPDGMLHVLSALNSGHSIHTAIVDLAVNGSEPLQQAFRYYEARARVSNPVAALARIREEIAHPVSDKAIQVLIEAHRYGTDVARDILGSIAEDIRADEEASAKIRTAQQEPRMTGFLAFGLPWLLLLLTCTTSPEVRDFYATGAGRTLLFGCGVVSLLNLGVMVRLAQEAPEPRVVGGSA
jgi:Flp pilus assembly protein TadB